MTRADCTCAQSANDVDLSLLEPVLARYADDGGALIAVLQTAQEVYGYLPREALVEIADKRRTPLSEVYGVATFYTQFHLEPRGKTIVRICHGTACHVAGAPEVTRAITDELDVAVGETSADLNFTVEGVACVGCCGLAPVVVTGDQVHGQLDPASARKLAKDLRKEAGL
jgi:NADH-quinone oxidoreductase subunit E